MSDFFDRLELQSRLDLQEIGVGALIGVLATATIVKYTNNPSVLGYLPSLLGSIPGASIVAGVIEHAEQN